MRAAQCLMQALLRAQSETFLHQRLPFTNLQYTSFNFGLLKFLVQVVIIWQGI